MSKLLTYHLCIYISVYIYDSIPRETFSQAVLIPHDKFLLESSKCGEHWLWWCISTCSTQLCSNQHERSENKARITIFLWGLPIRFCFFALVYKFDKFVIMACYDSEQVLPPFYRCSLSMNYWQWLIFYSPQPHPGAIVYAQNSQQELTARNLYGERHLTRVFSKLGTFHEKLFGTGYEGWCLLLRLPNIFSIKVLNFEKSNLRCLSPYWFQKVNS